MRQSPFICKQLNDFNYWYVTLIIQHVSFVIRQLNDYTYRICKGNSLLVILFSNELELIYLHASIAIVSTQVNGFKDYNLILINLFNINHLFSLSSIAHTNTNTFICTQLYDFKSSYPTQIITFSINHLFAHTSSITV